jgi:multimeric flavodoxin WrbA
MMRQPAKNQNNKERSKMSKVIAINGSPRKNANTSTLLQKSLEGAASMGADTELIHLIDLHFQGCISCFACKRKGTKFIGSCALQDDLTPVLEKVMQSDAVILGSPIYLGDVTSLMRAFIERFGFMNISYNNKAHKNFTGKINAAFFYTMNVPKPISLLFNYIYMFNTGRLKNLNGKVEQLICTDRGSLMITTSMLHQTLTKLKRKKHGKPYSPKTAQRHIK